MNLIKKSIGTLLPAMRISFVLVLLSICILLSADLLDFTPNERKYILDSRQKVSEALAIQFSLLSSDQDSRKLPYLIQHIVNRNEDILSAGIKLQSGQLIFTTKDHNLLWGEINDNKSTSTHVLVPVMDKEELWGNIELRYSELTDNSLLGFFKQDIFRLAIFILFIGFFVFLAFILRTLRQLDPTALIPDRVNAAFDTLAEGLIILDEKEQIILANKAFCEKIGESTVQLIGRKASKLNWEHISEYNSDLELPWLSVIQSGKRSVGSQLILTSSNGNKIKYVLNISSIIGNNNNAQGVLITLDDITQVEERNIELQTMVQQLEATHAQVKEQNKELHFLATRDPMTGCLNRRSFSEFFEKSFSNARKTNQELSCIMADLDHFKLVNDNYGHAVGDEVIKLLAEILHSNTRKVDLVGRYGGEEFCVVLPGLTTDEAFVVAERIRLRMKDESTKRFKKGPVVTASIGIASIFDNPKTPSDLTSLADEALYKAKQTGRNRVAIWHANFKTETNDIKLIEAENLPLSPEVKTLQNRIDQLETLAAKFSAELERNNNYDALTGLPNQVLFHDRITQVIERGLRKNQLAVVLIIDLTKFGQINTTLGRPIGDKLLQSVAIRLEAIFRKSDNISRLTISRLVGDEFAVFLTDVTEKEQVTWIVKRLIDELNLPFDIEENHLYIASKIGVSLYPSDANSVDELLNNAMTAKQHCKTQSSKLDYQFYDDKMQNISTKHLLLDKELRYAIENKNWTLLYQPKLNIKQKRIMGAEALIRWNHPERGLLSPIEFIQFAEQRGLIIQIGEWVIEQACKQLKMWMENGIHDCKIAINISSVQLMQPDIVSKIFNYLESYSIPPRLLELEITETILMDNLNTALEALKKLNARGISVAIDDFGTGYSSLAYLKNLPINSLKIDRSFIKDISQNKSDRMIVQTLISMAHSLEMSIIAEGVEDKDQLELLNQFSCDEIQGYLLSKPIASGEIFDMIKNPQQIIDRF